MINETWAERGFGWRMVGCHKPADQSALASPEPRFAGHRFSPRGPAGEELRREAPDEIYLHRHGQLQWGDHGFLRGYGDLHRRGPELFGEPFSAGTRGLWCGLDLVPRDLYPALLAIRSLGLLL